MSSQVPLSPQLCDSVQAVPTGDKWAAERKLDGWRLMVEMTDRGLRLVGGRNGHSYTGQLPYLAAALSGLPVGTILDGEITGKRDGGWNQVQSVMSSSHPHEPTVFSPALTYVVFDILAVGDGERVHDVRSWPWHKRREILAGALVRVPHVTVSEVVPNTPAGLKAALAAGSEGLVCKRVDAPYTHGDSRSWVKVKPQQTMEAVIRGFKPGKRNGRWAGKVGAFNVELLDPHTRQPNGVLTSVKCGPDTNHLDATRHPEHWVDQIIEIRHHGLSKDGVPRHPVFLRRRDDRTPIPTINRKAA